MIASYEGIGPVFKIKLELTNTGKELVKNTYIVLNFDETIYKNRRNVPKVPLLIPNLTYKVDLEVECIEATGAADVIKVFVFNDESSMPLITANVQMPVCEVDMEL